jgi:hypothetical protein
MQMRRRFQPMVDGLPCRIAPSTVAAVAATIAASPGGNMPLMGTCDADPPQTGIGGTRILSAPPKDSNGTLVC